MQQQQLTSRSRSRRREVELDSKSFQRTTMTLSGRLKVKVGSGELERLAAQCWGVELAAEEQFDVWARRQLTAADCGRVDCVALDQYIATQL